MQVKKVKSVHDTWWLFKTRITEAQMESIPKIQKGSNKSLRMPVCLLSKEG